MIHVTLHAITLSLLATLADPAVGDRAGPADTRGALGSMEAEQASLFARVAPSVVLLMRDGASGSGFVVGRDGLVLTNAHVVGEGDEVTVQLSDGRHGKGRVVARATGALDLALVRMPFDDLEPLVAGDPGAVRAGTFAATVGHGGGAAWTFSTGLIANPRPLGDGAPLLLAQMALRPGSSGGPLVDRHGQAIAVVTAGTRDASGVTFAIRVDAAVAAFPQLAAWASSASGAPPVSPATPAAVAEPRVAIAGGASDGPASVVERLSGDGASQRVQPVAGTKGAPMVTVWQAPRVARRAVMRSAAPRASSAVAIPAAAPAAPTPNPPARPPPDSLPTAPLVALSLLGGAVAGRVAARPRPYSGE